MEKGLIRFVVIGAAIGFMSSAPSGCAQKTASLEPATQTAKAEDGVSATADSPARHSTASQTADGDNKTMAKANAGAGPSEALDTPQPAGRVRLSNSMTDDLVEGSRTSKGLLPVYFDFNQTTIQPEQIKRISANALFLKNNPDVQMQIEGNCDDRGTSVYNLALGQLRATHAKNYLVNLGVAPRQLTTLSYGEERPVNPNENEIAWADNRRDDFVLIPQ